MKPVSRALLIAGLAAGILAGGIIAVVVPKTEDDEGTVNIAARLPSVDPRRVEPEARQPDNDVELRVAPGASSIEARTADPRGGPQWALRVFHATRVTSKSSRRPGVDPVVGHPRCAQLGRIYRGRFGWIDAEGVFRPVGFGYRGAPVDCGSGKADMARQPIARFQALITDPGAGSARVYRTVWWGVAGPAARSATVGMGALRRDMRLSSSGGYLVLGSGALHGGDATVAVRYAAGASKVVRAGELPDTPTFRRKPNPAVGPFYVEARAADPNGGLPWGIVARRSGAGGWCLSLAGRIVGDRVGQIDAALGTISENLPGLIGCSGDRVPPGEHPVRLGALSGAEEDAGSRRGPSRIARRTLSGLTVMFGPARDDVKTVTIETPRDVRTLVPSARAHVVIAVYDGTFPAGDTVITAAFRDGETQVDKLNINVP